MTSFKSMKSDCKGVVSAAEDFCTEGKKKPREATVTTQS